MDGLLTYLDTRSFSSLWYWLLLTITWTWVTRGALGVPSDLVAQVRRQARAEHRPEEPTPESLLLLDWLSLVAPRWRVPARDGAVLLALAAFVLSALAVLGFVYLLETAQALFLLAAPLAALMWMRLRLAAGLHQLIERAQAGELAPRDAADEAARRMGAHQLNTLLLSVTAVGMTAMWGTLWTAAHRTGF